VNIPKEINRFCPKCNNILYIRFLYTRLANVGVLLLEKEGMLFEKMGMEDNNSQTCNASKNNKESYAGFYMPRM